MVYTSYMGCVNIRKIFGENVRFYRKRAGLSQEQLASRLGVSTNHVSVIETGVKFVTYSLLEKLIEEFDVAPEALFTSSAASFSHNDKIELLATIIDEELSKAKDCIYQRLSPPPFMSIKISYFAFFYQTIFMRLGFEKFFLVVENTENDVEVI